MKTYMVEKKNYAAGSVFTSASANDTSPKIITSKKITILDPAMCCSTGICGVDVDEKLVSTAANVKWLKSLGYDVQRHNISNDGAAFKNYPVAIEKLQKEGTNSLPYILINDELVMTGKYPEKSEWESWIQADNDNQPGNEKVKGLNKRENSSSTGCCSGSGCC